MDAETSIFEFSGALSGVSLEYFSSAYSNICISQNRNLFKHMQLGCELPLIKRFSVIPLTIHLTDFLLAKTHGNFVAVVDADHKTHILKGRLGIFLAE